MYMPVGVKTQVRKRRYTKGCRDYIIKIRFANADANMHSVRYY